jgi:hypothetical protein
MTTVVEIAEAIMVVRAGLPGLPEGRRRAVVHMMVQIADTLAAEGEDREEIFSFLRFMCTAENAVVGHA